MPMHSHAKRRNEKSHVIPAGIAGIQSPGDRHGWREVGQRMDAYMDIGGRATQEQLPSSCREGGLTLFI